MTNCGGDACSGMDFWARSMMAVGPTSGFSLTTVVQYSHTHTLKNLKSICLTKNRTAVSSRRQPAGGVGAGFDIQMYVLAVSTY